MLYFFSYLVKEYKYRKQSTNTASVVLLSANQIADIFLCKSWSKIFTLLSITWCFGIIFNSNFFSVNCFLEAPSIFPSSCNRVSSISHVRKLSWQCVSSLKPSQSSSSSSSIQNFPSESSSLLLCTTAPGSAEYIVALKHFLLFARR